ncbi:hypothetical protein M885DRAFT_512757 [Pelagophyceae sp. CCMP2097]|nr:hypothetical protein M885DRAFT_512757 [Pelagophyceae sp. CCMP2097]
MEAASYATVLAKFGAFHQDGWNVWVHVLSCVVALVGVTTALQKFASKAAGAKRNEAAQFGIAVAWAAYAVGLVAAGVPLVTAVRTAALVAFAAGAAAKLDFGFIFAAGCVAVSYFSQDVAHYAFGELTYQSQSWGAAADWNSARALFVEHVAFLVPMTLDCATPAAKTVTAFLPVLLWVWLNFAIDSDSVGFPVNAVKRRVLFGKFIGADYTRIKLLRDWMVKAGPSKLTTSHWWVGDLDEAGKKAFQGLVESKCVKDLFAAKFDPEKYTLEPVHGMNELYVSAPVRGGPKNSDDVFFTQHVDGPFCWFPAASVYRCIVGMDGNAPGVTTHFPLARADITARDGEFVAFDFHRESHYITQASVPAKTSGDSQWRMVLKLHYVVAPKKMWWCCGRPLRWLSVKYNEVFRALFLATIAPTSAFDKFLADFGVNGFTVLYNLVEKYVGYANASFYFALAFFALSMGNYDLFLYGTQFLHYGKYMHTYYDRRDVAYGAFKRDALLYKTVALCQLLALYAQALLTNGANAYTVASLAAVAGGYAVSAAAAAALGVDGTYFGIELGVVEADYKFVTKFPYNALPHPMILGQVAALLGVHAVLGVAKPLLAPGHIALYLCHLAQEAFDFHRGEPWYKAKASTTGAGEGKKCK